MLLRWKLNGACHASDDGILGITPVMLKEYIQFIGDMRLEAIGLGKEFNSANPFPWLDDFTQNNMIETNFFRRHCTRISVRKS